MTLPGPLANNDQPEAPERITVRIDHYTVDCVELENLPGDPKYMRLTEYVRADIVKQLERELEVARADDITLYGRSWNDASSLGRALERRRIAAWLNDLSNWDDGGEHPLFRLADLIKVVNND